MHSYIHARTHIYTYTRRVCVSLVCQDLEIYLETHVGEAEFMNVRRCIYTPVLSCYGGYGLCPLVLCLLLFCLGFFFSAEAEEKSEHCTSRGLSVRTRSRMSSGEETSLSCWERCGMWRVESLVEAQRKTPWTRSQNFILGRDRHAPRRQRENFPSSSSFLPLLPLSFLLLLSLRSYMVVVPP